MYSSFLNQFNNIIHYFLGFIIVFVAIPRFIFSREGFSGIESIYAYFAKMVFLSIVLGYALVITKLYEFIGISLSLLLIYLVRNNFFKHRANETNSKLIMLFSDYVDRKRKFSTDAKLFIQNIHKKAINNTKDSVGSSLNSFSFYLLVFVMIYSAYIRFYDAIVNAPPAMADGYVNLAWIKYILNRQLFHDGIYPQGYYIFMAMLQKFAYIDPLYILKYSGPLNTTLIILGIFVVLFKLTNKFSIGIIGVSIYGLLGNFLPIFLIRQASSDGQEFGYLFIIPTLYFAYKYLENSEKKYLLVTFYSLNIIVLSHTIAYSFVVIGIIVLFFSALILNFKKYFSRAVKFIYIGVISAIIGAVPIVIGFAYGKDFHGSSLKFLSLRTDIVAPRLNILNYCAVIFIFIIFIYVLINIVRRRIKLWEVYILFLSITSFLIFYYGGVITQSTVVAHRFPDLWAMILPITIGVGVFILSKILVKPRLIDIFQRLISILLIAGIILIFKPEPIIPYKMDRNEAVEQYIRITGGLRPTEWIMISQEQGYPIALGKGYHLMVKDFLELYDPTEEKLVRKDSKEELTIPDIFIYNEKKVFRTDFESLEEKYKTKEVESKLLNSWIKEYKKHHDNLSVFYEDENMIIYRIQQRLTRERLLENIWGEN